jgi:hypothetical protein
VLTPFVIKAASAARGAWDEHRARRLGVAPGELHNFAGKGAALHARIAGAAGSLNRLEAAGTREQVGAFVAATRPRLADLAAAVRAAELMPTERRRAAYRAVAAELDRIEPQILELLGIDSSA